MTADGIAQFDRCAIMHQARTHSEPPQGCSPEFVACAQSIAQQIGVLLSFEHRGLVALAAFVFCFFWGMFFFRCTRSCWFTHPLFDSLAAEVLNQRNRGSVSRAHVVEQEVAG